MRMQWKKVVMVMLIGLLVAGPVASLQQAGASPESEGLAAAKAANDRAATQLQQLMTQMETMDKMPMTANEKAMMKLMHQMADTIKMLIDANKNLINVVEHGMRK